MLRDYCDFLAKLTEPGGFFNGLASRCVYGGTVWFLLTVSHVQELRTPNNREFFVQNQYQTTESDKAVPLENYCDPLNNPRSKQKLHSTIPRLNCNPLPLYGDLSTKRPFQEKQTRISQVYFPEAETVKPQQAPRLSSSPKRLLNALSCAFDYKESAEAPTIWDSLDVETARSHVRANEESNLSILNSHAQR